MVTIYPSLPGRYDMLGFRVSGSTVLTDVPDAVVVAGNPAMIKKRREPPQLSSMLSSQDRRKA